MELLAFALELGKEYGSTAILLFSMGWFFYQLFKSQERKIDSYIANEREEKGKLMQIINETLKDMCRILDKVEHNLNTSSCKIEKVECKIDKLGDRVNDLEVEIKTSQKWKLTDNRWGNTIMINKSINQILNA